MFQFSKIEGLVAAVFTPFTSQGQINPEIIPAYAAMLKRRGVAGVFVNGSSGEGVLMSKAERMVLAEQWKLHAGPMRVIVHVGSTSVEDSKELAAHAETLGVDAISCMAPPFLSTSNVDVMVDFCRQVASNAPKTPFYYYHLPVATGAHLKVNRLLDLGSASIPNLVGVKYTYTDFMDMHQCIALQDGRFDVLHGHDEILINGLVLGVRGGIGTTFNFAPEIYTSIMTSFRDNNFEEARAHQRVSIRLVEIMLGYVNAIVGGKAILRFAGIDCGPCRVPLRNLSGEELKNLERELLAADLMKVLQK
jgi:N-acetylneuraminate lyase